MRAFLCAVIGWLAVTTTADAQPSAVRFQCAFTAAARADGIKTERLDLEFTFDRATGKATLVPNSDMSDVRVHVGSLGLTFMEGLKGGVVRSTTIANSGRAVHSRHTITSTGEMIATQHYGTCK